MAVEGISMPGRTWSGLRFFSSSLSGRQSRLLIPYPKFLDSTSSSLPHYQVQGEVPTFSPLTTLPSSCPSPQLSSPEANLEVKIPGKELCIERVRWTNLWSAGEAGKRRKGRRPSSAEDNLGSVQHQAEYLYPNTLSQRLGHGLQIRPRHLG